MHICFTTHNVITRLSLKDLRTRSIRLPTELTSKGNTMNYVRGKEDSSKAARPDSKWKY